MKTFVCLLAFATAFIQVQKRNQPKAIQSAVKNNPGMAEVMLRDFCKN